MRGAGGGRAKASGERGGTEPRVRAAAPRGAGAGQRGGVTAPEPAAQEAEPSPDAHRRHVTPPRPLGPPRPCPSQEPKLDPQPGLHPLSPTSSGPAPEVPQPRPPSQATPPTLALARPQPLARVSGPDSQQVQESASPLSPTSVQPGSARATQGGQDHGQLPALDSGAIPAQTKSLQFCFV